jgi:hypothetical protein
MASAQWPYGIGLEKIRKRIRWLTPPRLLWARPWKNLVDGFKHFLFSISYMGCHPSQWRTPSFFKMVGWYTTNQKYMGFDMIFSHPEIWRIWGLSMIQQKTMYYWERPTWGVGWISMIFHDIPLYPHYLAFYPMISPLNQHISAWSLIKSPLNP